MGYSDYLRKRQVEKLARGNSVIITIDGERHYIDGSRITCKHCGECPA